MTSWTEPDVILNEHVDDVDFECFLEEVTASESSEDERPVRKKSPKKKPGKFAKPRIQDRQIEKKPQNRPRRPNPAKNGDLSAKKKKKTEPLKVKIEDEAQLMTKSRRSVIPTKFSEYVMLIDSSENDSSDGYSSADNTSSVDLPAAKPAVKRPGRRRRIDESADDSSDAQRRPAKSRRKYMTIKERIKLLKRFDALQPCSPTEAADIFGMNSESFSIIVDERDDLESRFADSGKSFLPKEDLETLKEALADFAKRNESNKATLTSAELKTKAEELKQSLNLSEIEVSKEWIDTWKADYETSRKELAQAENSARLGTELSNLVVTSRKNGVELSMDEIKIKCQALKDSLGITDVDVTDEWLTEWKKKSGKPAKRPYRSRKSPSSFICANEEIIDDWSGAVRAALINYHPDDIFNAVESGIYFKSLPGLNNSQTDWMTVFFACNMSGIEKKQLLVIGKSTNQLSLGILTLPVDFASNENAWMTAEIFTSFVTDWDRRAGQSRRRIALIVEESPVHPRVDLSWIELFFVPKNVYNLPPLKRGVISMVKNLYRKELLKAVKKLAPDSRQIESTVEKISVIDAAFMLSSAWAEVDKSSMVTAFVHSGFPFLRKPSLRAGGENEEHPDESRLNAIDERIVVCEQHRDVHAALLVDGHQDCINEVIVHADDEIGSEMHADDGDEQPADIEGDESRGTVKISDPFESEKSEGDAFVPKREVTSPSLNPTSSSSSLTEDTVWSVGQTTAEMPNDSKVLDALATIKRFLKLRNGNLEDLSDYTQLELKVLAKLQR
ncbi:tigger transposable element derived [Nesidiocoris tenuis]|nr:tigger transposable element derived [Nesidiocoris tenuis]